MPLGTVHPLDTDGASYHLYTYLAKERLRGGPNGSHLESARVNIPPTVIFEQGFAKAWFTSVRSPDMAPGPHGMPPLQIKRKLGREVSDLREIFDAWTKHCKDDKEIVALLVSSQKKDIGDPGTGGSLIHYFSKVDLNKFLFAPGQKPKGILQKFIHPKGSSNTTIQATWSPQVRTLVEGRRNVNRLDAFTKAPFERAATFEASESLAHDVSITPSVASSISGVCDDIVKHIHLVEHIKITGMVLHFKVDQANHARLLYSASIRVMTDGKGDKSMGSTPLNLSFRFRSYAEHQREEQERLAADERDRAGESKRSSPAGMSPSGKSLGREAQTEKAAALSSGALAGSPFALRMAALYKQAAAQIQADQRVSPYRSRVLPGDVGGRGEDARASKRVWRGNTFVPANKVVLEPLPDAARASLGKQLRVPRWSPPATVQGAEQQQGQPAPQQGLPSGRSSPPAKAPSSSGGRSPQRQLRRQPTADANAAPAVAPEPAGAGYLRGLLGEAFGSWVRNKEVEQDDYKDFLTRQRAALAAYQRGGGRSEVESTEVSAAADLKQHWQDPRFCPWARDPRLPTASPGRGGSPYYPPRLPPLTHTHMNPVRPGRQRGDAQGQQRAGRDAARGSPTVGSHAAQCSDGDEEREESPKRSALEALNLTDMRHRFAAASTRASLRELVGMLEGLDQDDRKRIADSTAETLQEVAEYCEELLYSIYSFFLCCCDNSGDQEFYFEPPAGDIGEVLSPDVMTYLFHHIQLRSVPVPEYFMAGRQLVLPEDPDAETGRRRHDPRSEEEKEADRIAALKAHRWRMVQELRAGRLAETYLKHGGMRRWPLTDLPADPPDDETTLPRQALAVPYTTHDVNVRKKTQMSIRQRLARMLEVPDGTLVHHCQHYHFLQAIEERNKQTKQKQPAKGEQPSRRASSDAGNDDGPA